VSPEAYAGGAIAAVRDKDVIRVDLDARELEVLISQKEIKARLKDRRVPKRDAPGYLARYRAQVGSASQGAVLVPDQSRDSG
jgi:dihydroxy-acid dehydratase